MRITYRNCRQFWVHPIRLLCLISLLFISGISCTGIHVDESLRQQADSLNSKAYRLRFLNSSAADSIARDAMALAHHDVEVLASSLLVMAYHAFSTMDYERADSLYNEVYSLTQNELLRLSADVGLMRVYQLTAQGKDFYEHREDALIRIRRVRENIAMLDAGELGTLLAVEAEYHMVMATYYCYFEQRDKALAEVNAIDENHLEHHYPELWLRMLHQRGAENLCAIDNPYDNAIQRFDYLCRCYLLSHRMEDRLLGADCLQSIASLMLENNDLADTILSRRPAMIHRISGDNFSESLPFAMCLADEAICLHQQQDNRSLLINSYSVMAACLIEAQRYAEAVDMLAGALDIIIEHHRNYYACDDSLHHLPTYSPEYEPVEIIWTMAATTQTVPEWILKIREQLSLAYAGMDMKPQSDYNRNIYLDLLDIVRQDKELENRYETLQGEEASVRMILWIAVGVLFLILLLFAVVVMRQHRLRSTHIQELAQILEECHRHLFASCSSFDVCPKEGGVNTSSISSKGIADGLCQPYDSWIHRNRTWQDGMEEERITADEQHALHLHRMQTNKRENMVKRASISLVQGVIPFIDRLVHECTRLKRTDDGEVRMNIYAYMRELTQEISVSNDLMTEMIQLKRGGHSLHVEKFRLSDLMDIVAKGHSSFERKGLSLVVVPTDCVIKADKALTLFMMNTLLDNARKYTPTGGTVRIEAVRSGRDVEILVSDTGPGIPQNDINTILNEKYYDSQRIGSTHHHFEEFSKQKGSGFGLMNCKGIIEKYRKSSPLFERVVFRICNRPEGGLAVSFVLPLADEMNAFETPILPIILLIMGCMAGTPSNAASISQHPDSLLSRASYFADQAYYCNVDRLYNQAVSYIDSSLTYMNKHYSLVTGIHDSISGLSLTNRASVNELRWLAEGVVTDYHILLDLRNEASVSFLGLHCWEEYRYNNRIYAGLYKELSRDTSLDAYCVRLNRSSSAKSMAVFFIVLLILGCLVVGYLFYMRRWMAHKFHLRQMMEVNRHLFNISPPSLGVSTDEERKLSAHRILSTIWEGVSDIFSLRAISLMIMGDEGQVSSYAFYPGGEIADTFRVKLYMEEYWTESSTVSGSDGCTPLWKDGCMLIPLQYKSNDGCHCMGVLAMLPDKESFDEESMLMAQMLMDFLSSFIHYSILKPSRQQEYTARAIDDTNRNRHEEMRLYVQNTVLDNCLSTIKHETMFYPNRISQILDALMASGEGMDEKELITELSELVSYYRDVYVLLSTYASRQTDEVAFHRTTFSVDELFRRATQYFEMRKQRLERSFPNEAFPTLRVDRLEEDGLCVSGDFVTQCFLMSNLLDEALSCHQGGELCLNAFLVDGFVRIELRDERRSLDVQALKNLFTLAHLKNRDQSVADGSISGLEFLICRQIIREHDEYMGHPGCRINAEPLNDEKGYVIWFTVPAGNKKEQ